MTKKPDTLANLVASPTMTSASHLDRSTHPNEAQVALIAPMHGGVKPKSPKSATKIVGFRLRLDTHRALKQASVDDGITAAARVQALIDIMFDDPDLAERVARRAQS